MKYRFLVFGAGAVGTYIGTSLLLQGHQVVFLERKKDRDELIERGLRMEIKDQVITWPSPEVISDLNEIKEMPFDLAIIALKTYHLADLLPDLVQLRESLPPILCLTNGVESEGILREALGNQGVITGTVLSAVDRKQKGDVTVQRLRGVGIAGKNPLISITDLMTEFEAAGLNPRHYARADDMKWSKLILNLLGNASSAILNMTTAEIYSHPDLFHLERDQVLETLAVMDRLGIKAVNLPGVPVRLLAFFFKYIPQVISQPILSKLIGGGRGEKMPSFHIDLHSGKRKCEVGQLNGAVVRSGKKISCPTPVNKLLTDVLITLIDGREPMSRYDHQPEVLLDRLV
jgi:2-dehydropantoate 2-reductase